MNRKKWKSKNVPLMALALKLQEEAAEVGTILTDTIRYDDAGYIDMREMHPVEIAHLQEELEHVHFLWSVLSGRVEEMT